MGNSFNIGSPAKGSVYPIGIEVGSTAGGGTITGNLFDNMVTAIILDRTSTGTNVQSNEYSNDSTMVKNLGTGNTLAAERLSRLIWAESAPLEHKIVILKPS
jgi:hypothetical protein